MKIRKILIKNRIIILFILIFFINCTKKINNKNLEKRNSTVDLKEKYLNYGFDAYVTKPINDSVLFSCLEKFVLSEKR